jgi:hypothetical protein
MLISQSSGPQLRGCRAPVCYRRLGGNESRCRHRGAGEGEPKITLEMTVQAAKNG